MRELAGGHSVRGMRPAILRRDPHDREIWRLAVPAFGALVGRAALRARRHRDRRPPRHPAARGPRRRGRVLTATFGIFNFLAYGTTGMVSRRVGTGDEKGAAEHGVAGVWLALALGVALTIGGLLFAQPIVDAMGASRARDAVHAHLPAHQAARRAVRARRARGHRLSARLAGHAHAARTSRSPPTLSTSGSRCCSSTASISGSRGRRGAR